MSTIVAVATPPGNAGVGIIRMSGPKSVDIISRVFPFKAVPRVVQLGLLRFVCSRHSVEDASEAVRTQSKGDITDDVVVIYFQGPKSFTGEDVVEIQAHGGSHLLGRIVDGLVALGATPAGAGEFSKRAFMNGKMSLDQAESIIETIHAESDTHLRASSAVMQGQLRARLEAIEANLVDISAQIEVVLDHPEFDDEASLIAQIKPKIHAEAMQIQSMLHTVAHGRLVSGGIQVAVLGRPNVGKSSLFNAILGRERAIVTEIAGTTTDVISESIHYNGMRIVFNDTAGLRNSANQIEQIGIQRTRETVVNADVVLVITDNSCGVDDEIMSLCAGKPTLVVRNKCDLLTPTLRNGRQGDAPTTIFTSAITGENVECIKEEVFKIALSGVPRSQGLVITNARHAQELQGAHGALLSSMSGDKTLDMVARDIADAVVHLGNITGKHASDATIERIFAGFCVGK